MIDIGLGHYLTLSAIIFTIGIVGIFLNRKNVIVILMSIELILLAVNINFVSFSIFLNDLTGQIFALFILTVAAAEAAIGLAIIVVYYRNSGTIMVEEIDKLKNNLIGLPKELVVHVHQGSIDYPRDEKGDIDGIIHPERINQDWKMIKKGDPLFLDSQGIIHKYDGDQMIWPVFIGEVAYKEKKIAMSYTKKEVIRSNTLWVEEFESL